MAAEPLALRQILRNAASYVLLIGLAELAGLPDALFVALAAMTVLEVNLGDGLKQGRQRVLATLVGTAVVVMVLGGLQLGGAPGAALAFLMLRLLIFRFALEGGLVVGGHVLAGSFGSHAGAWGAYVLWRSLMTLVGVGYLLVQLVANRLRLGPGLRINAITMVFLLMLIPTYGQIGFAYTLHRLGWPPPAPALPGPDGAPGPAPPGPRAQTAPR